MSAILYPFELVCPDGAVRHYAYERREDAENDARFIERTRCQFYARPSRLELLHGPCPGGVHRVRERSEGA